MHKGSEVDTPLRILSILARDLVDSGFQLTRWYQILNIVPERKLFSIKKLDMTNTKS
jgi:hypothetical protein